MRYRTRSDSVASGLPYLRRHSCLPAARIATLYLVFIAAAVSGLATAGGMPEAYAQQNQVEVTAAGNLKDGGSAELDGARSVAVFTIGDYTYAAVASEDDDGLQIVNVTNPASPATAGSLADDGPILLGGAYGVDIFTIGSNTYAVVVSSSDDGLQIVNVTNPDNPSAAGRLGDNNDLELASARDADIFTIGSNTYAAVASFLDDGLQIVNVTNPDNPSAAGGMIDTPQLELDGARSVAVFTIGSNTYAAVASFLDDGLQIVNVTNPYGLTPVGYLGDDESRLLDGAAGVAVFTIGSNTYAAVVSSDDGGIQLVNVTNPSNPTTAGNLSDDGSTELDGAAGVDVFTIGSNTYAAVASWIDDGIQLVNVTNPDSPTAAGKLGNGGSNLLDGASDVAVFTIGGNTYAAVASFIDGAIQLARLGAEVETPNGQPVAPSETVATPEDTPVTITPAISDPDVSDTPRILKVEDPPNGTATHRGTMIMYTPDRDYDGTDTFGYTVTDGTDTAQGTITVTVTRDNNAPVLGAIDNQMATPGIQLSITPTVTDTDLTDTHTYLISRGTLPADATFTSSDGILVWMPVQADTGQTHRITITVNDGRGGTDSETFDIVVADTDTIAPAFALSKLDGDTGAVSDVLGNQIDDSPDNLITLAEDDKPAFVSATLDGDTGAMTITFSKTVDVSATNLSLLYVSDINQENTVSLDGAMMDFGSADVETLSLTLVQAQLERVTPMAVPQLDISAGAVSDVLGNQIDDSPDNLITLAEDDKPAFVSATLDGDTGAMTITFSKTVDVSATNLSLLYVSDINQENTVSLDGAMMDFGSADVETLSLTLVQAQLDEIAPMGTPQLDITAGAVSDTAGNQIADSPDNPITVTGTTSNGPPVAPSETATTPEDVSITITPAISDPDTSDTPVISAVDDPPNGTATHDDTTITYTPDQDYDGTDTFGYTVYDGTDTAQGTITVTVTRDNNNPVLGTIGDQAATVGVQLTITPAVTDADTTDTHTYSITRGTLPAAAVFSTSDGTLVWTPVQADAGQTHTVTITVNDGRGGTDSETFDIVVSGTDTAPPAFESATLNEGTGAMTITFDETIDISATNLSLLYVSDVNQADTVSLTGAAFDFGSADVETLSLMLVQAQLDEIAPMGTPQLDIIAGAVSDTAGNQIADSPDNPITLTDAPVITLNGDNPLEHELGTPYVDPGATADDGSPVVIDDSAVDVTEAGTYMVIYTATNGDGRTGTADRTVTVQDTTKPVIKVTGSSSLILDLGNSYTEQGATVTDNDPDYAATFATVGGDTVDTSATGTYVVVYTAPADDAGNVPDQATRTVVIRSTEVIIPSDIITIGALVPQTGRDGDVGAHRTSATEFAVADFNQYLESRNVPWRMAVNITDTAATPDTALAGAMSLHSENITLISGPSASAGVKLIKPYADENDIIIVSCCSTSPELAIVDDNIFRLAPDDLRHGSVIADLMRSDGKDVMVSIWRNDTWGNGLKNATLAEFEALGGTADELGSYDPAASDLDGILGDLASDLAASVSGHVGNVGADRVSVLFIGFDETTDFVRKAADYPILRTVQWIGSDASVLDETLVGDPVVHKFLADTNFRACIFAEDSTSAKYRSLQARFERQFETSPNVYAYSSYDTIWVIGLALEAAGLDGSFGDIKAAIPQVASDYVGMLGDIELDAAGDLVESSYAVWGIDDSGWIRVGTYVPGVGLVYVATGGGDDDEWQRAPTFGISARTGNQMVSCGYSMDGICRNVLDYHVDYQRESIQTNTKHDFTLRAHSTAGIQQFQIGFGVPEVGSPISASEATLTVELGRDYAAESTYVILDATYVDPNDVIGEASLGVDLVGCMSPEDPTKCVELSIEGLLFREQMHHEPFVIFAMDAERWSVQNYMNDGILVQGDSMNPIPLDTAGVHKRGQQYEAVIIQLGRTDKLADLWADQWGNEWARNSHGTWYRTVPDTFERHQDDMWIVMTRLNSNFASLVQAEQDRAVLVFDAVRLISEPGSVFAYEYPEGAYDEDTRLQRLADRIVAEQLRAQEIVDDLVLGPYYIP